MAKGFRFTGLSGVELAKAFGKGRATVTDWVRKGCPRNQDSTFDLPAVADWREAQAIERVTPGDREAEETRRVKALADTYEHKLAVMRGEYIAADAVVAMWSDRVTAARVALLGLGASIGAALVGLDANAARRLIDGRIRTILDDLAREFETALQDADEETDDS